MKFGNVIRNSLRCLGPDIWNALPKYIKEITSFEKFEETITNWYGSSSKYTNTSGCTNLIYHADLHILWLLVWDRQTQCGQWSQYVYEILCILSQHHFLICLLENFLLVGSGLLARMWYLLWRDLTFPSLFQFRNLFRFCNCLNLFSVDVEFSEMSSAIRLISFKYLFASLVIEYTRLFSSCFLQA